MAERKTGNMYRNTSFRNSGRIAGYGIAHDHYDEDSGNRDYYKHERVRFPHDHIKPEDLNGEVIIIQKGRTVNG